MRVIATDLDGTLLRSDRTISDRSRVAIAAAEDAGVLVIFVTGRPLRWAREVFHGVGSHGVAIVANGALVWDVPGDKPLESHPIPVEVALEACRDLRLAVPGTTFAFERLDGVALESGYLERYPMPPGSVRGTLEEICNQEAFKILARHEELDSADFWQRALAAIGDRVEITWSSSGALLEMSAKGVTKASALAVWCASHGVQSGDVVAFGDMPNDIPMLEWAGTSYAVANAHPSVLAAAEHTTASNDDDGVALAIERLLDI